MKEETKRKILERLKEQKGEIGFFYQSLTDGESFGLREEDAFLAASVIKFPMFLALTEKDAREGDLMDKIVTVREEDKVPICGALPLFTGPVTCDVRTLCNLMISLSDNTATNFLMDLLGLEYYREAFLRMGLKETVLRRKLFDSEAGSRGLENTICPKEMAALLEKVYRGTFVSEAASRTIMDTLLLQQIDHKIPGYLPDVKCAHKTGEDDNLSNDIGIVFAKKPFIVCFAGNHTDVPAFENAIREISKMLYEENCDD